MFTLLDQARTLETKYWLLDPVMMKLDTNYTLYRPYAVCTALREEHGKLITDSNWPALATKSPESSLAPSQQADTVQCCKCRQWGHKAKDPKRPLFNQYPPNGLINERRDSTTNTPNPTPGNKPKDPWKYIKPKDLTTSVIVDGKKCWILYPIG